ncbi:hypothetical protein F4779DRAFT_640347 [Xylariaceae sp. FL0662B]|nr:hypothetical protein F4779DRAFT_640347 [Xylariaceae sp. FL0662B]
MDSHKSVTPNNINQDVISLLHRTNQPPLLRGHNPLNATPTSQHHATPFVNPNRSMTFSSPDLPVPSAPWNGVTFQGSNTGNSGRVHWTENEFPTGTLEGLDSTVIDSPALTRYGPGVPRQPAEQSNSETDGDLNFPEMSFPAAFVRPATDRALFVRPGTREGAYFLPGSQYATYSTSMIPQPSTRPNTNEHNANPGIGNNFNTQNTEQTHGFVPMTSVQNTPDNHNFPNRWSQMRPTGASPNYRGNPWIEANQSADIPEELNTALWIMNLPPTCTYQQLLGAIRGCGKVYATVINPPQEADSNNNNNLNRSTGHMTSAAKLVFFDRLGAERLFAQSQSGHFIVGGYLPVVRPNRIKSKAREAGPQCRVLHIEGPSALVNEHFLVAFFQTKFTFQLETILTLATHGAVTRQEWRFGSFRCQAESARQAITREKERATLTEREQQAWGQVNVYFGVDPCA